MEFLQIRYRTVCQLEFFFPLLLNELAPGCSLHPLKELDDDLINNAVQFLTGVSGLTVTVLRMADLVVADISDMSFPFGLTLGASAAAGGQHQLGTAVGAVDHPGEQRLPLGVKGHFIVVHCPGLHQLLCPLIQIQRNNL